MVCLISYNSEIYSVLLSPDVRDNDRRRGLHSVHDAMKELSICLTRLKEAFQRHPDLFGDERLGTGLSILSQELKVCELLPLRITPH